MALVGGAIGWELPARGASAVTVALALGLFGIAVAALLERVRDWQVALLSPAVGAVTGAAIGWSCDGVAAAAVGMTAGIGFGLMTLPPLVLMTDAARRARRAHEGSPIGGALRRRIWLLALAMTAMAAITVPALARATVPTAPHARLADLAVCAMLALAGIDGGVLIRLALTSAATTAPLPHPYREPALRPVGSPLERERMVLGECLTIDSLLLIAVGSALLLAR